MRTDVIRGRAAYVGMTVQELAERVREPGTMRLWELSRISKAVGGLSVADMAALGVKIRRNE